MSFISLLVLPYVTSAFVCQLQCDGLPADRRTACLPPQMNGNTHLCKKFGCCYDTELAECYRPLSLPSSGCPDKCNVAAVDPVEKCPADNVDSCVAIGCCWFPTELRSRSDCFRPIKAPPSARSHRPKIPDFIPTPAKEPLQVIGAYAGAIDTIDLEFETLWTSWLTQPCVAPCNGVGIQVQSRKCRSRNSVGMDLGKSTQCPGADKKAKICYGSECPKSASNQITYKTVTTTPSPLLPDCCFHNDQWYAAGDVITNTVYYTVKCSAACNIETELNEDMIKAPTRAHCYPSRSCGKAPAWRVKKIVGGSHSPQNGHPWSVMILKMEGTRQFTCGATVICDQWILTAAHCIAHQSFHRDEPDLDPNDYRLYFGRQFGVLYKTGPQVEMRTGADIERIIPHPNFNPIGGVMFNDIALIKLSRPLVFNNFVQPACLPLNGDDSPKPGETGWANGWGLTRGVGPDNTGSDR